jgi:hypothetical protein
VLLQNKACGLPRENTIIKWRIKSPRNTTTNTAMAAKTTLTKEATEVVDLEVRKKGAVGMTAATIAEATRAKEAVVMAARMGLTGVILAQEVKGTGPTEMMKAVKGASALEIMRIVKGASALEIMKAARVVTAEVEAAKVVTEVKALKGATTVETTMREVSLIREMGVA